jgi:hypothetical protein
VSRPKSPVLLALVCLPALALAALTYSCRRKAEGPWTVERLRDALEADGTHYAGCRLPGRSGQYGAYYLWRTGEPLADIAALIPQKFIAVPGRLRIETIPQELAEKGEFIADEADGKLKLGTLIILGHPDELRRVAEAVRP